MIRINRSTVVVVGIALLTIGLSVFGASGATAGAAPGAQSATSANQTAMDVENLSIDAYNDGTYSVVQGDQCIPITPLGDGFETAEEYYDYRHPETDPSSYMYSSHGTTHLQQDDTSILFLHEGGDDLSLMVVHGRLGGAGDGGAATFIFEGLPEDGDWAVEDDQYELEDGSVSDDVWDHRENASRISWAWNDGRTDGAVYSGLGDDFEVTVRPAFNDVADLQLYDGEVTDWQVVSGDDRDPERTSLDMTESIRIRSGGCTAVTSLDVNASAADGNAVRIDATVTNEGVREETVTVPIAIDGEVVDEYDVTVGPNEAVSLNTSVDLQGGGEQTVSVGGASATVVGEAGFAEGLPGFGVVVALAAILVTLIVGRRL